MDRNYGHVAQAENGKMNFLPTASLNESVASVQLDGFCRATVVFSPGMDEGSARTNRGFGFPVWLVLPPHGSSTALSESYSENFEDRMLFLKNGAPKPDPSEV